MGMLHAGGQLKLDEAAIDFEILTAGTIGVIGAAKLFRESLHTV
jgi:hypothetical protein